MKFLSLFHIALIIVFASLNGMMLYLFMLQLPYGLDPFLFSLAAWDRMSPQIVYVAAISSVLAVAGAVLVQWLPEVWKNRLLYARWDFSHPSSDAFLTTRKQPFENLELQAKFPMVKDSGFSRKVQTEVWHRAYAENRTRPVVLNTQIHWGMLRDLFALSIYFLTFFLVGWLINLGVPFQIVGIYMFLFGTQTLFLLFTARRTGYRMVDNVLALALGMEEDKKTPLGKKRK
ncbi:MAG: hypothetical protein OQL17_05290 [Sedimenticola sp.]|nr:hypothetical protein [Sedimenticola sp.]